MKTVGVMYEAMEVLVKMVVVVVVVVVVVAAAEEASTVAGEMLMVMVEIPSLPAGLTCNFASDPYPT